MAEISSPIRIVGAALFMLGLDLFARCFGRLGCSLDRDRSFDGASTCGIFMLSNDIELKTDRLP